MQIAIYGKGGIGKSTITSNLSGLINKMNYKVLQIGCDPKSDSTKLLMGNTKLDSVIDIHIKQNKSDESRSLITKSNYGVYCCEAGGPRAGEGCAGRGIIKTFEILDAQDITNDFDIVNYDVLGDVVCGGFAMPIRMGYADSVVLVLSGELMSIFAANNIMKTIEKNTLKNSVNLKGVILNSRNVPNEKEIVEEFCSITNSHLLGIVPRSDKILYCDINNKLFIDEFPDSEEYEILQNICHKILSPEIGSIPKAMNEEQYDNFLDRIRHKQVSSILLHR